MTWAMCGGRPFRMASVMKSLLKSCGVKRSGSPVAGSVRPVRASASSSRSATKLPLIAWFSVPVRRWNSSGDGGSQTSSCRSRPRTRGTAPSRAADPADDRAEHVGELGADDQEPFGVGLGGRDLQQRHELAGVGQPVLDEAVVAELEQFLDPDAGQAQDFDDRPRPERVIFLPVEQPLLAGGRVARPDVARVAVRPDGPDEGLPGGGEVLPRLGVAGCGQHSAGIVTPAGGSAGQDRQDREAVAGPGVHPRLAAPGELAPFQVFWPDRARGHPRAPAGRIVQRPFGQVQIERPDAGERVEVAEPLDGDRRLLAGAGGGCRGPGPQPLLPRGWRPRAAGAACRCRGGAARGPPRTTWPAQAARCRRVT